MRTHSPFFLGTLNPKTCSPFLCCCSPSWSIIMPFLSSVALNRAFKKFDYVKFACGEIKFIHRFTIFVPDCCCRVASLLFFLHSICLFMPFFLFLLLLLLFVLFLPALSRIFIFYDGFSAFSASSRKAAEKQAKLYRKNK